MKFTKRIKNIAWFYEQKLLKQAIKTKKTGPTNFIEQRSSFWLFNEKSRLTFEVSQ